MSEVKVTDSQGENGGVVLDFACLDKAADVELVAGIVCRVLAESDVPFSFLGLSVIGFLSFRVALPEGTIDALELVEFLEEPFAEAGFSLGE